MIVETSSFRLAEGVTEDDFLAADGRVQEELMLTKPALMAMVDPSTLRSRRYDTLD